MSVADAAARKGAQIAIAKVGMLVTYVRVGEGSEDLRTGVVTPSVDEQELRAYITRIDNRLVDGTKVHATDRMALIDAVSFEEAYGTDAEPSEDDRIQVGSRDLAVVRDFPVMSGEQYALHKIVVRR